MKPNDGGPAFPATIDVPFYVTHGDGAISEGTTSSDLPGMSLRDWFAGQALVGFLSNPDAAASIQETAKGEGGQPADLAAVMAYFQADAMLAEREKGGPEG